MCNTCIINGNEIESLKQITDLLGAVYMHDGTIENRGRIKTEEDDECLCHVDIEMTAEKHNMKCEYIEWGYILTDKEE